MTTTYDPRNDPLDPLFLACETSHQHRLAALLVNLAIYPGECGDRQDLARMTDYLRNKNETHTELDDNGNKQVVYRLNLLEHDRLFDAEQRRTQCRWMKEQNQLAKDIRDSRISKKLCERLGIQLNTRIKELAQTPLPFTYSRQLVKGEKK